jgi:prepilin-type N-terminal cleavage/methylation domain-containing protein
MPATGIETATMFYNNPGRSNQGFTLLEMGLVIFILVVIAGMAIPMTAGMLAQERLKGEARELQDFATEARKLAVKENRPYEIVLKDKGYSLELYHTEKKAKEDVVRSSTLGSNVRYSVERWGERGFELPASEPWIFQPDGICEPIRVRFESKKAWMEYSFAPLTARPTDESYYFP